MDASEPSLLIAAAMADFYAARAAYLADLSSARERAMLDAFYRSQKLKVVAEEVLP